MKNLKCLDCGKDFKYYSSGVRKRKDGSIKGYIYKFENGKSCPSSKKCYKCFKSHRNSLDFKNSKNAWRKSEFGFLCCIYQAMKKRVNGNISSKRHLKYYEGKEILSREEFLLWASECKEYKLLHKNYVKNGFKRKFAPTVDRIDSSMGYTLDNMQWLTQSENSKKALINRRK